MTTENTVHQFEKAGLGLAPFRFLGAENTAAGGPLRKIGTTREGFDVLTTPGGTCAFCGQGIVVLCHVISADGKRFHVGQDCIRKVGDAGLVKGVRKAVNKVAREKAAAKAVDLRARIQEHLEANASDLQALPHPNEWRAAKGETLYDALQWRLQASGMAGVRKLAKEMGLTK